MKKTIVLLPLLAILLTSCPSADDTKPIIISDPTYSAESYVNTQTEFQYNASNGSFILDKTSPLYNQTKDVNFELTFQNKSALRYYGSKQGYYVYFSFAIAHKGENVPLWSNWVKAQAAVLNKNGEEMTSDEFHFENNEDIEAYACPSLYVRKNIDQIDSVKLHFYYPGGNVSMGKYEIFWISLTLYIQE